ncbi:uncharacterized protein [Typha angustifolia]|uniref:uncharacterized protein n=1 Tax=Typha angustifolia TaxID=59011 RepID=UPI003C2EB63A
MDREASSPSPESDHRETLNEEGEREEDPNHTQNPQSSIPSLFPLFPFSSNASSNPSSFNGPQWLSNPSFTFDVSALPDPGATSGDVGHELASPDSDDDAPTVEAPEARPRSYDLVPSSPSPSSSEEDRKHRRSRRRKKRKREKEGVDDGGSRKSGIRAWAGSDRMPAKDYYFDVRGDRDNLAFGCLYRMDIARYKRQDPIKLSGLNFQLLYRWGPSASQMDVDEDQDALDSKMRAGGRYYSVKYATLERDKGFKHVKNIEKKIPSVVSEEFVSLESHSFAENGGNISKSEEQIEESWEDELIRRTREFNKMSREFPHDEKVWLAFADFQDKIASGQPQKAARLQTIEKKISILEKAVELNPDSEDLLISLLKSYRDRDGIDNLLAKWEKVLMQHSDSSKLWKEYLLVCQGEFSRFKVSEIRKSYAYAIQALSSACDKLSRQDSQTKESSLVQLETGLVDIFLSLCRFEWQTGYQELATGLFQAELEYSLFCPTLLLTSHSKQRLFEHFWNSDGARIGEDGAIGWSKWLEKDESRQKVFTQEIPQETGLGGWSGWFNPSRKSETSEEPDKLIEGDGNDDNISSDDTALNDDVESLLKKLGVNVDVESSSEVKDAKTWNKWSSEELSRAKKQWMPVREHSVPLESDDGFDREGNEQLSRVISFEDVNDYLFSLSSAEARLSLVCQFIDFYGGKISQWTCTNKPSWIDLILSLEILPDPILDHLKVVSELVNRNEVSSSHRILESLLDRSKDFSISTKMIEFVRNAILLCLDVFPRYHMLEEAVLIAEEKLVTQMNYSSCSVNPSRALAKILLKKDRQDLLLCGIYARREATHGNIELARKIFDMALSSVDGLPKDRQESIPLLYFWYADTEMTTSNSDNTIELPLQRAIHILSCLGSNTRYTPFKCAASSPQILRARQGFKEQIKSLRSTWARGVIKEHSIALIFSASLFESLTSSCSAGLEIIEEAFTMALPDRRCYSLELESLWVYYIGMLQKNLKQMRFSRTWRSITQGLQIYPYNPKTFTAMLELSCLYSVPNRVRLMFDKCSRRNPSVIVWLFALSFEWDKAGSQHRIHGLFERALADEKLQKSVLLWRCYLAYEADIACNPSAARRVLFRAIHACPWSKRLWLDGFQKLSSILTVKELSDLQEVMRDKELHIRTDIYEILLQDEMEA